MELRLRSFFAVDARQVVAVSRNAHHWTPVGCASRRLEALSTSASARRVRVPSWSSWQRRRLSGAERTAYVRLSAEDSDRMEKVDALASWPWKNRPMPCFAACPKNYRRCAANGPGRMVMRRHEGMAEPAIDRLQAGYYSTQGSDTTGETVTQSFPHLMNCSSGACHHNLL